MDEAILQDLLVSLRCLISSALLISMSCALFDFRGVKKGKVFLFATLIALVGSALVGVAFHFSSPDYTLIAALYFPILTFCYAALFLWLFHDNVWYTLFVFALVATFYFLINVFSEIFLRILPSPYWSNGVYFSLRLLLIPVASALVHHFLHDRLLEDKKWIGKQFLYPCLLEVALFFLLLFVGAVPSAWYLRDPSIHWLLAYCGLFIPTVDLLIRRFIHNLIRQERRKEEEEEMRLKLEGMEKAIEAESLQKEKDAKARHAFHLDTLRETRFGDTLGPPRSACKDSPRVFRASFSEKRSDKTLAVSLTGSHRLFAGEKEAATPIFGTPRPTPLFRHSGSCFRPVGSPKSAVGVRRVSFFVFPVLLDEGIEAIDVSVSILVDRAGGEGLREVTFTATVRALAVELDVLFAVGAVIMLSGPVFNRHSAIGHVGDLQ